jgi:Proteasome maturation factor UMP1
MKLTMLRNAFGMHAPIRLLMERKIVGSVNISFLSFRIFLLMSFRQNGYLPAMQKSNLHLDILMGRDEMIEPADIFGGACCRSLLHLAMSCNFHIRIRNRKPDGYSQRDGKEASIVMLGPSVCTVFIKWFGDCKLKICSFEALRNVSSAYYIGVYNAVRYDLFVVQLIGLALLKF